MKKEATNCGQNYKNNPKQQEQKNKSCRLGTKVYKQPEQQKQKQIANLGTKL